jgi:hypothetical protein
MARQQEAGTTAPMRPATAIITSAADFTPPVDSAGAATWTTASSALTPVVSTSLMNTPYLGGGVGVDYITASGEDISLLPGQYLIEMYPLCDNSGAGVDNCSIAITNGDASVVHAELDPDDVGVEFAANEQKHLHLKAIVHITATSGVNSQLNFKALNRTAGTEVDIKAGQIAMITKIGNVNES